jgi:pilus assembly protein Flp/PilA
MDSLVAAVRNFANDEDGITAIEYGLIAALIVVLIVASMGTVTTALDTVFDNIVTTLNSAN